ncbi:hypothetical protein [Bradyrhizobium sp.]|uniref:hypothetical protein n=1 Tax=Bradyrhizobium sp. TaxID=376 RepID=UPI0025C208EA|nr:hypothetical protein [Bradyrhizobium sp.]
MRKPKPAARTMALVGLTGMSGGISGSGSGKTMIALIRETGAQSTKRYPVAMTILRLGKAAIAA